MHPSASCPSCPTPPRVRPLQVGPYRHVSPLGALPAPHSLERDESGSRTRLVPELLGPTGLGARADHPSPGAPAMRCVCSGSSPPLSEPAFWPPDGNMGSDAPGCHVEKERASPCLPSSRLRVGPSSVSRPLDFLSPICETA